MGHALETLHGALRPRGHLLDVRPAPQDPWIELRCGGGADASEPWIRLGQVDDSYRAETLRTADAALLTAIESGRFARVRAETFTFVYHFDSAQTLLDFMAEHWSTARISGEVVARAREERPGEAGAVRVLRIVHAQLLRRV